MEKLELIQHSNCDSEFHSEVSSFKTARIMHFKCYYVFVCIFRLCWFREKRMNFDAASSMRPIVGK